MTPPRAPSAPRLGGMGDLVALLLRGSGIGGRAGCGCDHRRELLNKMFPFPRRSRGPKGITRTRARD